MSLSLFYVFGGCFPFHVPFRFPFSALGLLPSPQSDLFHAGKTSSERILKKCVPVKETVFHAVHDEEVHVLAG